MVTPFTDIFNFFWCDTMRIYMQIQLMASGIEIDERLREIVETKVTKELQKYLTDFDEDLQKAVMRIEKLAHHGFKANFDLRLPGSNGHIYSEEEGDDLTNLLVALRKEVEMQIRNYKDKLQSYR